MDKNGDGVLQYVMLKGEPGHQDAELRTEYSIKNLQDNGIKVQKLAEDTGMWDRVKGQEKMAAFIASQGDKIEAVFANNDDMALGAIEALKAAGYFKDGKFMPVVGVDATAPLSRLSKKATLLGPVLNDAVNQGVQPFMLSYDLARGITPPMLPSATRFTDGKYVLVPYQSHQGELQAVQISLKCRYFPSGCSMIRRVFLKGLHSRGKRGGEGSHVCIRNEHVSKAFHPA
jgi:methyl-galactoside transport system substrate-binding protein